jgi:hypothetical protein
MHQAEVSFVQGAHRGHEPDGAVFLAAQFARDGTHPLPAIDYFHKKTVSSQSLVVSRI